MNELEQFKSTYYASNPKNVIFKKQQKSDLATKICEQYSLDDLFHKSVYRMGATNRVFIEYPIVKLFINSANYEKFVDYAQQLMNRCIQEHGSFECHVNLDTLTISAVERHQRLVELFCTQPAQHGGVEYTLYLLKAHLYNCPSIIDNIMKLLSHLLDPDVISRLVRYTRAETNVKLALL